MNHHHEIVRFIILGQNIPVAGGGYLRLFPYRFLRWAIRAINQADALGWIFYQKGLYPMAIRSLKEAMDFARQVVAPSL